MQRFTETNATNSAATSTTERYLRSDSTSASYWTSGPHTNITYRVDLSALAAGDVYVFRLYKKVASGGTAYIAHEEYRSGVQSAPMEFPPISDSFGHAITAQKVSGTDRTFTWSMAGDYLHEPYVNPLQICAVGSTPSFVFFIPDYASADPNAGKTGRIDSDCTFRYIKPGDSAFSTPSAFTMTEITSTPGGWYYFTVTTAANYTAAEGIGLIEISYNGVASRIPYHVITPKVDVIKWNGTAVATPTTAGVPRVDVKAMEANVLNYAAMASDATLALGVVYRGTATAGAAGTITLGALAGALGTDDALNGCTIQIVGGAGVGQTRTIRDWTGLTGLATIAPNWTTTPDNTSVVVVHPFSTLIQDGGITANGFAASSIAAAAIATGAITNAKFAAGAIDATAIASNAITSAKIATDAIGAAQIAADAIGSSELAASAVTEIQTGLSTSAALTIAQADLDDIQTRLPAALVGGRMDSSVGAMAANVITAAAAASDFGAEVAAAVWAYVVEGTKTAVEYYRIIKAGVAGKAAISGTTRTFRDDADTKDRITATVGAGGRTAVTVDGT